MESVRGAAAASTAARRSQQRTMATVNFTVNFKVNFNYRDGPRIRKYTVDSRNKKSGIFIIVIDGF